MRRIKIELSYDGTNYKGWQTQPDVPTIQNSLEVLLSKITGERISVIGSGRTDAGVHAIKQVAAFNTESKLNTIVFQKALNGLLPFDIRVLGVEEVELSFHPIRSAISKRYRYLIDDNSPSCPMTRNYCWICKERINLEVMDCAGKFLLGEHDFSSFQTTGSPKKTTVRTILDVKVERFEGLLFYPSFVCIEVEATGFLYNMMRSIVGTLVMLTRLNCPESMREIINSCSRSAAGQTAPPQGLYLLNVKYK
ncbi:MAG: tRNA pseudouridine(38-40) synthase TruA [Planctomycetaceae bacterium]|nr:tRNA pseudouridine(38-40) synthase TruA [Planctomycetaceae bacterium]